MTLSAYSILPIGFVQSPYKQKFGVARQPGLVPSAVAVLELLPEFSANCVRGLTDFDYVWVHFVFHGVLGDGWASLVRPPRLGGRKKMGVFATRSPHRPNHLGLSLLKLECIETGQNVRLHLSGADLLDGTPVIDIKPYIPFAEAKPNAAAGFATVMPPTLTVRWHNTAWQTLQRQTHAENLRALIEQSIAQDPRPAYHDLPERVYAMHLADFDVCFQINAGQALILDLRTHDCFS